MIPSMIFELKLKIDVALKGLYFCAYAMFYADMKNTMKIRSVPAIALKASNETGGFYFIYLYTKNSMHSYIWYELPIYHKIIRQVEELYNNEDQTKIDNRNSIVDEDIIIPENDQILEGKIEEEILNSNNEEI